MRRVFLLLAAGCRLNFDARDEVADATPADASAIAAHCGANAIVCDDFESDAYQPWEHWEEGGTVAVEAGCGTGGSRCARSNATTMDLNARLAYRFTNPITTVTFRARAVSRSGVAGESQLIAIDFFDGAQLSTQVGVMSVDAELNLYEYDFVRMTKASIASGMLMSTGMPHVLSLSIDHATKTARLAVDGTDRGTLSLTPGFATASAANVLVGLWVRQPPFVYDFDDVDVR